MRIVLLVGHTQSTGRHSHTHTYTQTQPHQNRKTLQFGWSLVVMATSL